MTKSKALTSSATKETRVVKAAPRSVTRVLGLFVQLAQLDGGASLTELSLILHSPKSSLLVLLRPLVAEGYLIHESGKYRLGPAIYRLASTVSATRNLNSLIRPYIAELAAQLGESVYVAVIDRDAGTCSYIEGIDCTQAVRFVLPLGQARNLYSTAAGRVLLAYQDSAWIDKYLQKTKLLPVTEHTIVSRAELKVQLTKIRESALAVTIDEGHTGATGIAAPIVSSDNQIWAALLVAMPTPRYAKYGEAAAQALLSLAKRASGDIQAMSTPK